MPWCRVVFPRHNKKCKVFLRHNMKCHPEEHRWLWDPFEPVWRQTNGWLVPTFGPPSPPHPPCLQYTSIQKFDTSHFYFSPFKLSNSPMCLTIVSLGLNPNFLLPAFEFPDKQRKTSGPPNIILNPPQAAQITHRSIRLSPLDIMRLEICTGYQKKWVFCLTLQKPQTKISEIQIDSAVIQIKVK